MTRNSLPLVSPLVLGLLLMTAALLFLSSCTVLEPSLRQEAMMPGIMQGQQKPAPPAAPSATPAAETGTGEAAPERDAMQELTQREADFNRSMQQLFYQNSSVVSTKAVPSGEGSGKKIGPETVKLHFDQADLVEVLRVFMDLLQENFIINAKVGGKVTLELDEKLDRAQITQVLQGILRLNGAAMVRHGQLLEIVPLSEVPGELPGGQLLLDGKLRKGQAISAFHLRYITAAELAKIIKPYLHQGAMVYAHEASGILLVSDYPHVLQNIASLVKLFDVSVFADLHLRVYFLQKVLAEDILKELESLTKTVGLGPKGRYNARAALSFMALPRLNMILAMTRDPQVMAFADQWIHELDRELPEGVKEEQEQSVFIYSVQNGIAADMVEVLKGLFGDGRQTRDSRDQDKKQPPIKKVKLTSGLEKKKKVKVPASAVSGALENPVTFIVDETTNSILVRATGSDYRKILPVIKKLDLYPRQVLIEVTIAEILLDERSKLGIEWSYLMNNILGTDASSIISLSSGLGVVPPGDQSLIGSGLTYLVTNTNRLTLAIKAFANQNRVNVLSSPHILAFDNHEARIDIGEEVPIVTSEYRTTESGSTATTTDKTIQYRDTGVILTVTPHINENGMVRMDITQEVSEVSEKTVEGVNSPLFNKRIAATTLAVKDEQTIVIGGIIKQLSSKGNFGVPYLTRVPWLKYLFGYEGKIFQSTELMIFITPHVIKSEVDSSFVSRAFLDRLAVIKAKLAHQ